MVKSEILYLFWFWLIFLRASYRKNLLSEEPRNWIKTECALLGIGSKWNLPILGCALFGLAHCLFYYSFPDMTGVHSQ